MPITGSYLMQGHLRLICQRGIDSSFFDNVYTDGRQDRALKNINPKELKGFFRKCSIIYCDVVSCKMCPACIGD